MMRHLFRLGGLSLFVLMAIGSGTTNPPSSVNASSSAIERIRNAGVWLKASESPSEIIKYDYESLRQDPSGAWSFYLISVTKKSPQYMVQGPALTRIECESYRYDSWPLRSDGTTVQNITGEPIRPGLVVAELHGKFCGRSLRNDDRRYYFVSPGLVVPTSSSELTFWIRDNEVLIRSDSTRELFVVALDPQGNTDPFVHVSDCSTGNWANYNFSDRSQRRLEGKVTLPVGKSLFTPGALMWDRACNDRRTFMKKTVQVAPQPRLVDKISEAKKKCEELGLKPGTESFGNCVLKLSR